MNKQIFYTDDNPPNPSKIIVANDVLPEYAQGIVDNLNTEYGGTGTRHLFAMQDQPA